MVGPAYPPWDLRQQGAITLVYSEDDLRRVISSIIASNPGSSVSARAPTILIAKPITVTRSIKIPKECAGLTITSMPRMPITVTPAADVTTSTAMFTVLAERVTLRDFLVRGTTYTTALGASATTYFPIFVKTLDPGVAGRSASGLTINGCEVASDKLYVDGAAGAAPSATVSFSKNNPNNIVPGAAVTFDSADCQALAVVCGTLSSGILASANATRCRIVACTGAGNINTSASAGGNRLAANTMSGNKALATSDIDDDLPAYARGTFGLADGFGAVMTNRLQLTSTQRFTGLGTSRLRIT